MSKLRLCDNYLRFYHKYIEPEKDKIQKGLYALKSLESLPNWSIVMGFQFENLVLNNLAYLMPKLNIEANTIVSASPYFQNAAKRNKGACQIDLLIETTFSGLYVCEIKFRKKIGTSVIKEVQRKIDVLKKPKNISIRPILIYSGELSETIEESGVFDKIISFDDLLETGGV